jgi:predicted ATP-binding protein involved in virulence
MDNALIENDDDIKDVENEKILNFIKLMKKISGNVKYINEQRLYIEKNNYKYDANMLINVIDELPSRFINIINEVANEYSYKANKLDSTYPSRLFQTKNGIKEYEYLKKMDYLNKKLEKLKKYDISDINIPKGVNFKEEHAKALKVYFEDFELKYNIFSSLIKKLDLFTDIINSRLKFKEIQISRKEGISIRKKDGLNKILLNQLSSGEKQEIILFYELIFDIDNDVHLLIDEPEISLHIEWQLKFLDDLLKISNYKNLNVVVATHSPQIINNHWDIQIDLGEEYGD